MVFLKIPSPRTLTMINNKKRVFAGITQDDELYFLEIEPKSEQHNYFAMSGFTIRPLLYEDAVKQSRESLEDGEYWRQAVESERTELGLSDWIDQVLEEDGEISQIDNSLYSEQLNIDGEEYIFESGSCGQHKEKNLKYYAIDKAVFNSLMDIWEKNHLKKVNPKMPIIADQDNGRKIVIHKPNLFLVFFNIDYILKM